MGNDNMIKSKRTESIRLLLEVTDSQLTTDDYRLTLSIVKFYAIMCAELIGTDTSATSHRNQRK